MTESYRITDGLEGFDRPYGARHFSGLRTQGSVRYTTPATKTCRWGPRFRGLHPGLFSLLPPGAIAFCPSGAIYGARLFGGLRTQGSVRFTTPATKTCRRGPRFRGLHPGLFSLLPLGASAQQVGQEWIVFRGRARFENCETESQLLQGRCAS
jgi:hypothetical protein